MTFSIVARLGDGYGVAVASKFLAVGAVVPGVRLGVGAVATQSFARVAYVPEILDALAAGAGAAAALDAAVLGDAGRETRQVGCVGADGAATFTGRECMPWCGGLASTGEHGRDEAYAIQGNILTGPEVVNTMQTAWRSSVCQPLPRRLLAALSAGDDAGGDSRGRQSAALYVLQPGAGYDNAGVAADLRVDDHADPVGQLWRLLSEWEMYFGAPEDVSPLEGDLLREVGERLGQLGYPAASMDLPAIDEALADWAGEANYECRLSPGGIDARVLAALRAGTSDPRG